MITPLAIVHGNCPDGMTAAWVLHHAFNGQIEIHYGTYGEEPPQTEGRYVIFADFSYKEPVMREIVAKAAWVNVFDHHASAIRYLSEFGPGKLTLHLDTQRCGSMLVWDTYRSVLKHRSPVGVNRAWFKRAERFIEYIQDRDLYLRQLDHTDSVSAAIASYPFTLEAWDELTSTPTNDLISAGEHIQRYRERLIEEAVAQAKKVEIRGHEVWVTNCTKNICSEVGHELALRSGTFGGYWFDRGDGYFEWGLRSVGGFDVSKIAEALGGGGHPSAAGFRTYDTFMFAKAAS